MKINTNLETSLMINKILSCDVQSIKTKYLMKDWNDFNFIEFLAQSAGIHARYLMNFDKHAFLLSIKELQYPHYDFESNIVVITFARVVEIVANAILYEVTTIINQQTTKSMIYIGLINEGLYNKSNILMHKRFKCLSI